MVIHVMVLLHRKIHCTVVMMWAQMPKVDNTLSHLPPSPTPTRKTKQNIYHAPLALPCSLKTQQLSHVRELRLSCSSTTRERNHRRQPRCREGGAKPRRPKQESAPTLLRVGRLAMLEYIAAGEAGVGRREARSIAREIKVGGRGRWRVGKRRMERAGGG